MDNVRPNGQITKVGWGPQPLDFSLDMIVQKIFVCKGVLVTIGLFGKKLFNCCLKELKCKTNYWRVWTIEEWKRHLVKCIQEKL